MRNQNTQRLNRRMPAVFQDFQRNYEEVINCISDRTSWPTRNSNIGYNQSTQFDLSETEEEYCAEIDMPGVSVKKIDLKVQKDRLIVTGERENENGTNGQSMRHPETPNEHLNCMIELPQPINTQNAFAEYKDGVLKVTVKKATDVISKPLKINVARR